MRSSFWHDNRAKSTALEVRGSIDWARVMILIQCALEWRAALIRTRGLLPVTRADSGATHQISIIIIILLAALLLDAPDYHSQHTEHDGTTDANHHTDDNLLV